MKLRRLYTLCLAVAVAGPVLLGGCSRKFTRLRKSGDARVEVALPSRQSTPEPIAAKDSVSHAGEVITFKTAQGEQLQLVPVAYDEQLQESVMNLQIEQVTISVANIRNVAERNGQIELEFQVTLPRKLQDDQWRVVLEPVLCMAQDTFTLQPLVITGTYFRRIQQQDMKRYERYLETIVDSTDYFESFGDISGFETYLAKAAERRRLLLADQYKLDTLSAREAAGRSGTDIYTPRIYRKGNRRLTRYTARTERRYQRAVRRREEPADSLFSGSLASYLAPRYKTAESPQYEQWLQRELSDSSKTARYRLRRKELQANIRMLSTLDTAALMQEYYDLRKIGRNEQKRNNKEKVFRKLVRFPELADTKLDTIARADRNLTYKYTERLDAGENSNKIYLFLNGTVTAADGRQYRLPVSDTLTFSVTSMTSFVDPAPRYVQRVVKRDAEANARFFFVFPKGKSELQAGWADNRTQLEQIKILTQELMTDPAFIIDSVTLTATSSPEGSWRTNEQLARRRSVELKRVLEGEFRRMKDSLEISGSYMLDANGNVHRVEQESTLPDLPNLLHAKWKAEDWDFLRRLIQADSCITDKERVLGLIGSEENPDKREQSIRRHCPDTYAYMRSRLYPQMRAVDFRFSLHRRGMKQDTVWTTVLDSNYMHGVEQLRKRRYNEALELLRPYEDRNTALAYLSVGLDRAAARILRQEQERHPNDPELKYMLAIVAARLNDSESAVTNLLRAAELRPRLRFRANLDPELAALIRRYDLFSDR